MSEETIFEAAIQKTDPAERAAYLESACTGDPELRRRVEALLRAHEHSGDLLDPPLPERGLRAEHAGVAASPGGKPQAFRLWRASATAGELEATVARYLGAAQARRAFEAFMSGRGLWLSASDEADAHLIRHAEHLLSPAIGASTSRLVLSLLLRRRATSRKSALRLLDDASAAIQSSRDQLQHALDHALITAPAARDPAIVARLDAVAGRVLQG